MIEVELLENPDNDWNKRLLQTKLGSTFQTKEHAFFLKEAFGWEPLFLRFLNGAGKILAQTILSKYPRFTENNLKGKFLRKILKNNQIIYRWIYGPVLFEEDYKSEICKSFNDFIISNHSKVFGSEHPLTEGFLNCMENSFKVKNWATFLIDLSQPKEDIWTKLEKNSARKNVRRSIEKGVIVKEMTRPDLKIFHELRKEKINKKPTIDLSLLELRWDYFQPIGWTGFLAFYEDVPIGGIQISFFNKYINETGIVRSEQDLTEKLCSQDLLKWKIIEWGKENGHKFYDLTGVNPYPTNKKELGILRYKKKWGGQLVKYNLVGY